MNKKWQQIMEHIESGRWEDRMVQVVTSLEIEDREERNSKELLHWFLAVRMAEDMMESYSLRDWAQFIAGGSKPIDKYDVLWWVDDLREYESYEAGNEEWELYSLTDEQIQKIEEAAKIELAHFYGGM